MQKIILGISIVSTLVFTAGCGSDSDDEVSFEDIKVEYKTEATYDLSEYILPAQNQISNYVNNVYTNKSGKREYSKTPDEGSPTYNSLNYDVNGSVVKESNSTSLVSTYTLYRDKIVKTENNSMKNFARFADSGNYILKDEQSVKSLGNVKESCKVSNHLDTKKVSGNDYSDVIELQCEVKISDSNNVGGEKILVTGNQSVIKYYAKGKGLISSVTDYCRETKAGDKVTKSECIKYTSDITTIN